MGRKKTTAKKYEAKPVTVFVRCDETLLAMLDEYIRSEPDVRTRASALRRLAIVALTGKSRP
jgi:hypothetical protein